MSGIYKFANATFVYANGQVVSLNSALGAAINFSSNGAIIANVVPRYQAEATLLSTAGSPGEIASASDSLAIVKFNGIVNSTGVIGAVKFTPFVNYQTFAAALPSIIEPVSDGMVMQSTATGTSTLANGLFTGQKFEIVALKAVSISSIIFNINTITRLSWNGTAWIIAGVDNISAGTALGPGSNAVANSFAAGIAATTSNTNAMAIGSQNPVASGLNSVIVSSAPNTASGNYSILIASQTQSGLTTPAYSFSINPVQLATIGALTYGFNNLAAQLEKSVLYAATTTNTATVLTTDGAAVGSTNEYYINPLAGNDVIVHARVVVIAKIASTTGYFRAIREVVATVVNGTPSLIESVLPTSDTKSASMTTASITISMTSGGALRVTANPGAAIPVTWIATIDAVESFI